jgi:cytochrome c oxidase subunit I+III
MIFLMAIFGYLFVYGVHPTYWVVPTERWRAAPISAAYALAAASVVFGRWLLRREESTVWSPTISLLFAAILIVAGLTSDWFSWQAQGIDPELTAQGAFSHAMLALQGQLVAVVILMGGYLAARTARGLITRPCNTTFDVVSLFLLYTCAQGAATTLLLRFFPSSV